MQTQTNQQPVRVFAYSDLVKSCMKQETKKQTKAPIVKQAEQSIVKQEIKKEVPRMDSTEMVLPYREPFFFRTEKYNDAPKPKQSFLSQFIEREKAAGEETYLEAMEIKRYEQQQKKKQRREAQRLKTSE